MTLRMVNGRAGAVVIAAAVVVILGLLTTACARTDRWTAQEQINAAIADFDDFPFSDNRIAYDVIDATVDGDMIHITSCEWMSNSRVNIQRTQTFKMKPTDGPNGEARADFYDVIDAPINCVNTALTNAALQLTRDWDDYTRSLNQDPSTFDAQIAAQVLRQQSIDPDSQRAQEWAEAGLSGQPVPFDGQLPQSSLNPVLGRLAYVDLFEGFEVIACRPREDVFGLYQEYVHFNEVPDGTRTGSHAATNYRMRLARGELKLVEIEVFLLQDCPTNTDDWTQMAIYLAGGSPEDWMPWPLSPLAEPR